MKRQYMDFVPTKSAKTPVVHAQKPAAPVAAIHKTTKISSTPSRQAHTAPTISSRPAHATPAAPRSVHAAPSRQTHAMPTLQTRPTHTSTKRSVSSAPALGVIEDLSPRVATPAPRQTLANSTPKKESSIKSIKSQKIGNKAPVKLVENSVENSAKKSLKPEPKRTFIPPKFINQDKVTKRPLSKNVYRKKIEPAKESTKKPVTIIAKPDKDNKVGIIVAIILTIILGAAAGTVAFLLLPK